jgi:hypothetical protein
MTVPVMYSPDDRAMTRSPDPVAAPDAYRREILGWLGDDDPALVQASTVERLRNVVRAAGPRLRDRPAPGEWSVVECVGHLADSEVVTSARLRWIVAEDEPAIIGYDQDRWVDRLAHRDDDPDELIAQFEALRAANLRLWRSLPAEAPARFGIHSERGPESIELIWRLTAGHDRFHVAQAERALASLAAFEVAAATG